MGVDSGRTLEIDTYLRRASALELARRSLLGAPVYVVISLIMLVGTPILADYGWWALFQASLLIMLGVVRVLFARGFSSRYEKIGEKAVVQFSTLTALQSLALGVLAGSVIYKYWATQEVVLTIVLSAGVIAASTSALSVRRSAHFIFLLCVLGPFGYAVYLVGGPAKAILINGYLILMAFLVQDGGQARTTYSQRIKKHFEDKEERSRTASELRKLAQAVDQSPESIIITNLNSEIEYVNERFLLTSGYSLEEVIGKNPRIKQSGKTPPENYTAMWEALSNGRAWKGEFYNRRKDGSEYVELARIAPLIQPDGTITHYVAIQEDITEKKRLAEELENHRHHLEELVEERTEQLAEAREHAEFANRAKSSFVANMSHEIRTPMNAILGLTHLLQRDELTPEQSERLSKINTSADYLMSIINDILDLSKIEAGKLTLEESDFHTDMIFDHILSMLREQATSKKLTIEVDRNDVAMWLSGDATRVNQILLNYVSNAIKFTEQGRILLRAKKLEERDNVFLVRFEVQDTGVGIEAEKLQDLFSAFEQVDTSITRKYGGTGLGLAINRRLARLMNGEVGVESEPGQGSTFWFTAPFSLGRQNQSSAQLATVQDPEAVLRSQYRNSRIMLVEDNAVNREVAEALLEGAKLDVQTAENGREAVAMARTTAFDLVLMDVQMPVMDGLEATRQIRAMAKNLRLPILAMTANIFEEDRQTCLKAGMNDFVAKPVDPVSLFSTIIKWLPVPESLA